MTIRIPLSKNGKYAGMYETLISDEDADLANIRCFVWLAQKTNIYARTKVDVKSVVLHRIIMERVLGRKLMSHELVDHVDNDGLNNQRDNLRLASYADNARNTRKGRNNSTGYKGVHRQARNGKYKATIAIDSQNIHLGVFQTPEKAHEAYCKAAKQYFGEFANSGESSQYDYDHVGCLMFAGWINT